MGIREDAIKILEQNNVPVTEENIQQTIEAWVKTILTEEGVKDDQGNIVKAKPLGDFFINNEGLISRKYQMEDGTEKVLNIQIPVPELKTINGKPLETIKEEPTPEPTVQPTPEPVTEPTPAQRFEQPPEPLTEQVRTDTDDTLDKFKEPLPGQTEEKPEDTAPSTSVSFEGEPLLDNERIETIDGKKVIHRSETSGVDETDPGFYTKKLTEWNQIEDKGVKTDPRELYIQTTNVESDVGKNLDEGLVQTVQETNRDNKNIKESVEAGKVATTEKVPLQQWYDEAVNVMTELKDMMPGPLDEQTRKKPKPYEDERKAISERLQNAMTAADKLRIWDTFLGGLGDITAGLVGQYGFSRPTPVSKYFKYRPTDTEAIKKSAIGQAKEGFDAIKDMEDFIAKIEKQGSAADKEKLDALKERINLLKIAFGATGTETTRDSEGRVIRGGGLPFELLAKQQEYAKELQRLKNEGKIAAASEFAKVRETDKEEETGQVESKVPDVVLKGMIGLNSADDYLDFINEVLLDNEKTPEEKKESFIKRYTFRAYMDRGIASKLYDKYVSDGGLERLAKNPNDLAETIDSAYLQRLYNDIYVGEKEGTKSSTSKTTETKRKLPEKEEPNKEVPKEENKPKETPKPQPTATPTPAPTATPAPKEEPKQTSGEVKRVPGKYRGNDYPMPQNVIQYPNGEILLLPSRDRFSGEKAQAILSAMR